MRKVIPETIVAKETTRLDSASRQIHVDGLALTRSPHKMSVGRGRVCRGSGRAPGRFPRLHDIHQNGGGDFSQSAWAFALQLSKSV